jgi:hypothetical protein
MPANCKTDIRGPKLRRSAIEPAIGQMKTDPDLERNRLKVALSDLMHSVMYGAAPT